MRSYITPLAFALCVSGRVVRSDMHCVQLEASGGASGTLGQLGDGQNRVGGDNPKGCYCLSNGGFTDSNGRGCILTPPTTQFQCDKGASPTTGFSINGSGDVEYNGNGQFYACPVNDQGVYNVYSQPLKGQKCVEISLHSGGACGASSPPPKPPKPSGPKPCPADLNGAYQFPHLIIPVSSSKPDEAPGTSYFGEVSKDTCSIFNFDIPASYSGKQCTLVFLFPKQQDLQTSSFTLSGSGAVDFSMCDKAATQKTSWNNKPYCQEIGSQAVSPGNSYVVQTMDCKAGQTVTYEMCSTGDLSLKYFQDYNPSPIGLYIREC